MDANTLTILIVAGPGDGPYIHENLSLIERTHVNLPIVYVVNNSGAALDLEAYNTHTHVSVIDGVPSDPTLPTHCRASYHHAAALNQAFRAIVFRTHYVLILDPDFYVIGRDDLSNVLQHMQTHALTFFGAPWHPRWYSKWRGFPCTHFLMVDLQRINPETLDFTPDLNMKRSGKANISDFSSSPWKRLYRLASIATVHRRYIGRTRDTGYHLHETHHAPFSPHYGLLQPVMSTYLESLPHLRYRLGRLLESCLPGRLSYLPKPDSYTTSNFASQGHPDLESLGWEEFRWEHQPFAFHLRRYNRIDRDKAAELKNLRDCLYKFSEPPVDQ